MQNDIELHYINLTNQYNATMTFYSDNYLIRFLKVITIIIFFVPTILMSLIALCIVLIHSLLKRIPIIGLISGAIAGLANLLLACCFDACNLPELTEYRNHRIIVDSYDIQQSQVNQKSFATTHTHKHIEISAVTAIGNALKELSNKIDELFQDIEPHNLLNSIKLDTIEELKQSILEDHLRFLEELEDMNFDLWAFISVSSKIICMIADDIILEEYKQLEYNKALGLSKHTLSDLHKSCAKIALDKGIISGVDFYAREEYIQELCKETN